MCGLGRRITPSKEVLHGNYDALVHTLNGVVHFSATFSRGSTGAVGNLDTQSRRGFQF